MVTAEPKIYWKHALFRPNDDWMSKNMDKSLVRLAEVPFPGKIPDFACCPYGTNMSFNVEGKRIVLPSDYRNENPAKFPEYDSAFALLKHKITTNGVFAGFKPYVAEALRRNEKCLFLVAGEREPCTMNQHRRKVVDFGLIAPPGESTIESEFVRYDLILTGNWVKVIGHGKKGRKLVYVNMSVPADTPVYAEALYGLFENNVILNKFVENAGANEHTELIITLSDIIERNHKAIDIMLTRGYGRSHSPEWAVRTLAEHSVFRKHHPEIDLETLLLVA